VPKSRSLLIDLPSSALTGSSLLHKEISRPPSISLPPNSYPHLHPHYHHDAQRHHCLLLALPLWPPQGTELSTLSTLSSCFSLSSFPLLLGRLNLASPSPGVSSAASRSRRPRTRTGTRTGTTRMRMRPASRSPLGPSSTERLCCKPTPP
jgi:hypothetical protein